MRTSLLARDIAEKKFENLLRGDLRLANVILPV